MSGALAAMPGGGWLSALAQGLRLPWSLAACGFELGGRLAAGMWSMWLPPALAPAGAAGAPGPGGASGRAGGGFGTAPPVPPGGPAGWPAAAAARPPAFAPSSNRAVEINPHGGDVPAAYSVREEPKMSDVSLADDMVKLVQFAIVSVRRDIEDLDAPSDPLVSGQEVVSDNLRDMDFSSYIIARYCDQIPPWDRRYIRVWYQVLDRWPKASLNYEERQLRELRRIANCVCGEEDRPRNRAEERREEREGEGGGEGRGRGRGRQSASAEA